jgi:signal transduction histidine kinase
MSAIYAWLRRHQILVDSVLAAVLTLLGLHAMLQYPWPQVPMTALLVLPVVFRRKAPIAAFGICQVGALWQISTQQLASGGETGATVAVLVMLYTVAAYRPRRPSITALWVCLAASAAATITWSEAGVHLAARLFAGGVMFGGSAVCAWLLGDSMRYRRGYYAALEDRAARLEAERDAQAKIAAAAERARIARELHDVIAHHVSVMVVQADGAGYALHSDPATAEAALKAISGTGRQALTEMRRLLGVLRTAGDQAQLAPVPGLGELRELLDQARAAGLAVTYTLSGTPQELPEGVELAAYRVVQESLTNTRKHAGLAATATVTLRYEKDELTVEVTDDGIATPAPGLPGHGLAGMRERVAMYGGTVEAGPLPRGSGGFRVLARFPCPLATAKLTARAAADGGATIVPAPAVIPVGPMVPAGTVLPASPVGGTA